MEHVHHRERDRSGRKGRLVSLLPVGGALVLASMSTVAVTSTVAGADSSVSAPTSSAGQHGNTEVASTSGPHLAISTAVLPVAAAGGTYGPVALSVTGVTPSVSPAMTTVTWSKGAVAAPAKALPAGFAVSSAGVLSGKPSPSLPSGSYNVTVKVTEKYVLLNPLGRPITTTTTASAAIPLEVAATGTSGVLAVSTGDSFTCALITGGTVKCWGYNYYGELGNGTTTNSSTPVVVPGLSKVTAIASGEGHTCALIKGGTVKCWGEGGFGELGDGSYADHSVVPVAVTGLNKVVAISAAAEDTCATVSGGTAECWGDNTYGQLGNGTIPGSDVPVAVSGLSGVVSVVAGGLTSCAVVTGGTVECWGFNMDGQLGDGTTIASPSPVPVTGLSGVTVLSNGGLHACALGAGSQVECWGFNYYGAVGNATSGVGTNAPVPVPVSGPLTAYAVASSGEDSCALVIYGIVGCWGNNDQGQLGNGTTTDSNIPVEVTGLSEVFAVSAGPLHTCGVVNGGTVDCWGNNQYGELGDGTGTSSSTPVAVTGL